MRLAWTRWAAETLGGSAAEATSARRRVNERPTAQVRALVAALCVLLPGVSLTCACVVRRQVPAQERQRQAEAANPEVAPAAAGAAAVTDTLGGRQGCACSVQ